MESVKKANHVKKVCGTQLFLEDGCSRSKASFSTMAFHIVPQKEVKTIKRNMSLQCTSHALLLDLPSNINAKLPVAGNFSLKQRVKTSKLVNFSHKF